MDQSLDADGAVRLSLCGELDVAVVERLETRLRQLKTSRSRIRLDLSGLDFMDSTGLRLILLVKQRSEQDGWNVEIERRLAPAVERVFQLAHIEPFIWH